MYERKITDKTKGVKESEGRSFNRYIDCFFLNPSFRKSGFLFCALTFFPNVLSDKVFLTEW